MLYIFTTKKDPSALLIKKELPEKVNIIFYSELKNTSLLRSEITHKDKIILRDPYNSGNNYEKLLKEILKLFPKNILLDYKVLTKYPNYEDKKFQVEFMKSLGLKVPETITASDLNSNSETKFQLLMKKRISSRNKGNFIVNSLDEISKYLSDNNIDDFIFQKIINFEQDIRVIVFKKEFLGAVIRDSKIGDTKFKVKIGSETANLPEEIKNACILLSDKLGTDLIGIDLLKDFEGNYYFIEANVSPQFSKFSEISRINIAKLIIKLI